MLLDFAVEGPFQTQVHRQRPAHVDGFHAVGVFQDRIVFGGSDDAVDRPQDGAQLAVARAAAKLTDDLEHRPAGKLTGRERVFPGKAATKNMLAAPADPRVAFP